MVQVPLQEAHMRIRSIGSLLIAAIALSACATVPKEIAKPPPGNPGVAQVRADIQHYVGQDVRWGGNIVSVTNDANESSAEIIARDLTRSGRPEISDMSPGRFIAVFEGFIDPEIYYEGRAITVVGTIEGERTGKIGEREYKYPVVKVKHQLLWQMYRYYPPYYYRSYYYDYYYDPFFYPYPYPYYYPYYVPAPRKPNILRNR
jgi:outer membrane lipoprotein